MFSEQDLNDLIELQPRHPVLSVYLDLDPAAGAPEVHRRHLRQLLKGLAPQSAADAEAVERYLDHQYDGAGRSLAAFSCAAEGLLRTFSLRLPLRSRVRWMDRPYVKPLADLLDNFGGYGVAVVDKQGARLFHFHLGALREQEGMLGETVRRTKHGGGSQAPGRRGGATGQTRHAEEVADRNLKEAARFAQQFFRDNRVRRVLIGGTDENTAQFRGLLPKAWQSLVAGTFSIEMGANHDQVLEKAMEIAARAEREKEGRLVESAITAAAKGREGAVGLDDALAAAHTGRVQTLLLSEGYRAAGFRCSGCGFLTTQPQQGCPFCGKGFVEIDDAVEHAVRRVLADGGEVEVVHDNPALDRAGRIAAVLRY
jgi:peptide chain release factor subunit 1